MKKTSLVLALAVISGVSALLDNEVKQQTNQNIEGITQQVKEENTLQSTQENNGAQPETKQTPTNTNIDWTKPGMQLSDWEYQDNGPYDITLSKYIGRATDTVYVPAYFKKDIPYPVTVLKGSVLEGSTIRNLKIVNFKGSTNSVGYLQFGDAGEHSTLYVSTLEIPDNSIVSSIEFIGGSGNINFEGSEVRAQKNDFIEVSGINATNMGLFGNVVKVNEYVNSVYTDLKYVEYINAGGIAIVKSDGKRINSNPLYMQANEVTYSAGYSLAETILFENHYQLNQLLDGMGIKSTMQLKLDANGGNGGVVIQQPVFFTHSLTDEQKIQIYQNKDNPEICVNIAFLENPTYYPTLEGRTFLGWEKQPTNTRTIEDAFNQTYLAKWSDPAPVPTVTPTQPQQPVVENKPTASVNTANSTTATTLATVALVGCVGLITLRRFK